MKNSRELHKISHASKIENSPIPQEVLQDTTVEIRFLATSWLDDFEKKVFEGKTVNQIINPQKYE